MANNPRLEVILRHAGSAWPRAAVRHEYQPQMRPMNAAANAENTAAFNITAYITSQAKPCEIGFGGKSWLTRLPEKWIRSQNRLGRCPVTRRTGARLEFRRGGAGVPRDDGRGWCERTVHRRLRSDKGFETAHGERTNL